MTSKNETKLYSDSSEFIGKTYEQNVGIINNLYFGQTFKISNKKFIERDETDKKFYFRAFSFELKNPKDNPLKITNYPTNFLNLVFCHENLLFDLSEGNNLAVFEFKKDNYIKYIFPNEKRLKNDPGAKIKKHVIKINESVAKKISETLVAINKNPRNLKENYESLCYIKKNYLEKEKLNEHTKKFSGSYVFKIEDEDLSYKYKCTISFISFEVDGVGKIREALSLNEGKINLDDGISSLFKFIELKENKQNDKAKNLINNDFKTPIIYKNFDEKNISENKTIIFEVKAGFSLGDVEEQLQKRINFITNCLFEEQENDKPEYFIGVIKVYSENKNKLKSIIKINTNISFKNIMIIATVDNNYCGLDASFEVHPEYLLYKELGVINNTIKEEIKALKEENKQQINAIKEEIKGIKEENNKLIKAIQEENNKQINAIHEEINIIFDVIKVCHPFLGQKIDQKRALKNEVSKTP